MILAYDPRLAGRVVQSSMALLPIVPILLLPFILVFFVVVFPLWGLALGVLGLCLLLLRGLDRVAGLLNSRLFAGAVQGLRRAFDWVLTFGGLAKRKR